MAIVYSIGQVMRVLILVVTTIGSYLLLPPSMALGFCLTLFILTAATGKDYLAEEYCAVVRGTILVSLGGISMALFLTPFSPNLISEEWTLFFICAAVGGVIIFFTELFSYRP